VKPEILKHVGQAITTLPENIKPHRAVKKIFDLRAAISMQFCMIWKLEQSTAHLTMLQ
jgi:2-oxoglutarate dehydrogenase E1 component